MSNLRCTECGHETEVPLVCDPDGKLALAIVCDPCLADLYEDEAEPDDFAANPGRDEV